MPDPVSNDTRIEKIVGWFAPAPAGMRFSPLPVDVKAGELVWPGELDGVEGLWRP